MDNLDPKLEKEVAELADFIETINAMAEKHGPCVVAPARKVLALRNWAFTIGVATGVGLTTLTVMVAK